MLKLASANKTAKQNRYLALFIISPLLYLPRPVSLVELTWADVLRVSHLSNLCAVQTLFPGTERCNFAYLDDYYLRFSMFRQDSKPFARRDRSGAESIRPNLRKHSTHLNQYKTTRRTIR